MGVFPLADTMIPFSDLPWSRGAAHAGASGWSNEVWWYADRPMPPRPDAAPVHSPNDSLTPTDMITRCSGTGPGPRAVRASGHLRAGRTGRPSYRTASAVPELAAGNGLQ